MSGLPPAIIGIDLVEVGRVRKLFARKRSLRETVFTPEELRSSWRRRDPYISLAVHFAVKEALFKALGTGLSGEMDWRDVALQEGASGTLLLQLFGKTARLAQDMGIIRHALAVSHTKEHAAAFVLLLQTMARELPVNTGLDPA